MSHDFAPPIAGKMLELAAMARRVARRRWPPATAEEVNLLAETVEALAETVERLERRMLDLETG